MKFGSTTGFSPRASSAPSIENASSRGVGFASREKSRRILKDAGEGVRAKGKEMHVMRASAREINISRGSARGKRDENTSRSGRARSGGKERTEFPCEFFLRALSAFTLRSDGANETRRQVRDREETGASLSLIRGKLALAFLYKYLNGTVTFLTVVTACCGLLSFLLNASSSSRQPRIDPTTSACLLKPALVKNHPVTGPW